MTKQQALKTAQSPFNRNVQHEAKRSAILSEAARLFNSQGSRATTLKDIAEALKLTKTSLYYYIKTKEELIYECYLSSANHQRDILGTMATLEVNGLEKVRRYIQQIFIEWRQIIEGNKPHYALLLEVASLKPKHRKDIEKRNLENLLSLQRLVSEGIDDGSIGGCDSMDTTLALMGIVDWSPIWILELAPADIDSAANTACDIIINGIAPRRKQYKPASLPNNSEAAKSYFSFDRNLQNQIKLEAFLSTGTRCFNLKGFKGTSLDEIAEELNVTKGAFYYHIKNKEDLLVQCYNRSIDLISSILEQADNDGDNGLKKIELCCRRTFAVQNSNQGPLINYSTIVSLPSKRRTPILKKTQKNNDQFGAFLSEGNKDGSIRAVDTTICEQLLSGALYTSFSVSLMREVKDWENESAQFFNVFFNGLKAR